MSRADLQPMGKVRFYGLIIALTGWLVSGLAMQGRAEVISSQTLPNHGKDAKSDLAPLNKGSSGAHAETSPITTVPELNQHNPPATTANEWIAQIEAATVQITDVTLNRTATGLEVVLQTAEGRPLQVDATKFRTEGTSLIADIPNAVLALPNGQDFIADNPTTDVATVRITQPDANTVRVSVTGYNAVPRSEVTLKAGGLAYSLTPDADEADEEIVVTGDRRGYAVPNASTATRTDTPLRDIPQSIQVLPRQVLEDRQVIRASEALNNVSGVQRGNTGGGTAEVFNIRGFQQFGGNFRDGFRDGVGIRETANLERIEVLKGPASVLYGNLDPGGVINFVTKQPLSEPFYAAGLQVGSFGLVRPTLDLSGPLNPDRTLLYRLNVAYERGGDFRKFDTEVQRFLISPVVSWKISDRTDLILELDYQNDQRPTSRGLVAIGRSVANIPFDRVLGEPDDFDENIEFRVGYRFEHRFNDDWKIRNRFRFSSSNAISSLAEADSLNEETGELSRTFVGYEFEGKTFALQTDVVGKFATGAVKHTLLFGVDLSWQTEDGFVPFSNAASINIFDCASKNSGVNRNIMPTPGALR